MSPPGLFLSSRLENNNNGNCAVLLYNCRLSGIVPFVLATASVVCSFEEIPMQLPHCPKCNSEYTYEDNGMFICPECAHEWNNAEPAHDADELIVKDANGNLLADGDSVTVIKDLKVKGSSSMLKIGTKVKNIRLVEGDHNIDCKIDGFGPMKLKSEFVKKN
ncbi:UNVERIFIED_ORG: protein PhnA [Kosakonia oryzae]|nr:protein PhnA [Kosakonia oryzae]